MSNKRECDSIAEKEKNIKNAVQVCWEFTEENKKREFNGLLEAMKYFNLNKGLILTNDQEDEITIDDKKIEIKPVWKWLLQKSN